jgi:hypothetical protein
MPNLVHSSSSEKNVHLSNSPTNIYNTCWVECCSVRNASFWAFVPHLFTCKCLQTSRTQTYNGCRECACVGKKAPKFCVLTWCQCRCQIHLACQACKPLAQHIPNAYDICNYLRQHAGCYGVTRQVRWSAVRIAPGLPISESARHVRLNRGNEVLISPDISDARGERARGPVAEKCLHHGESTYRDVGRNTDNTQNYVRKTLVLVLGRGKEDEGRDRQKNQKNKTPVRNTKKIYGACLLRGSNA